MNGPKVEIAALVKPNHMREHPHTAVWYSSRDEARQSKSSGHGGNPQGRSDMKIGNPQRLNVRGRAHGA